MWVNFTKRAIDVVAAICTLLFLSPVLLVVACLIKLESPGPVFFTQRRVGIKSKEFTIYKFRSMRTDTPNVATDKLTNPDQYITRIGKFIRKTSLDELPQLLNILKGDMSFVGPRPALYNQYELIESRDKAGVHQTRPGLTGYAQVMGRDFVTDEQKVEYDKYYVQHASFLLDVRIVVQTFFQVVQAKGISN